MTPEWNCLIATVENPLSDEVRWDGSSNPVVKIEVFSRNTLYTDSFLGEAIVPVEEMIFLAMQNQSYQVALWLRLQPNSADKGTKKVKGEVLVRVKVSMAGATASLTPPPRKSKSHGRLKH